MATGKAPTSSHLTSDHFLSVHSLNGVELTGKILGKGSYGEVVELKWRGKFDLELISMSLHVNSRVRQPMDTTKATEASAAVLSVLDLEGVWET